MKYLILLLTFTTFNVFAEEDPIYKYHCMATVNDLPKIKFRGDVHHDTFEKVVKLCLSFRVQKHVAFKNRSPTTERTILYMEDCVNHTFCKQNIGEQYDN